MRKYYLLFFVAIMSCGLRAQDQFVAEIRMFAGNFPPKDWAFCDGQILPISQNTALFSLLGTTYGGDGKSTFALPNLNGRVPIGAGQGPGLSVYDQGQEGGADYVTLMATEMPAHSHVVTGGTVGEPSFSGVGNVDTPKGNYPATSVKSYSTSSNANMGSTGDVATVDVAGGSQPHNNLQPYLVVRYIIALRGIFPPRS